MATAKEIKKAMAKKQGFSGNPQIEFLHFQDKVAPKALELYQNRYHEDEIPAKCFNSAGRYGILLETLLYCDARGRRHRARAGLLTDFGSIPRLFWTTFGAPAKTPYLPAYLIHDDEVAHAMDIPDKYLRKQLYLDADDNLREMGLFITPKKPFKIWRMYKGVRIGSWWRG